MAKSSKIIHPKVTHVTPKIINDNCIESIWFECRDCGYQGEMSDEIVMVSFTAPLDKRRQCPKCDKDETGPIKTPQGCLLVIEDEYL
jgi:hypothetical protein